MNLLELYGLNNYYTDESKKYPELNIGRVISQYNDLYMVITSQGELLAGISGKKRYSTMKLSDFPAVGDFVMLDRLTDEKGNGIIHDILPRKSFFERKAVGIKNETQIIATNIDIVFICMSLNSNFNLRRLERYTSIAWASGATPVIVLTKSDLCADTDEMIKDISNVAIGIDIVMTTTEEKESFERIRVYVGKGKTAAFIGSSGVGKSTIINFLIGKDVISTNEIRNDDKGRHTTTRRELILLSEGGMVIDTPGMKEIGVESADFSKSFSDIEQLAEKCRFKDCAHKNEPGCAVKESVDLGIIDNDRLKNYLKLKKEANYEGLNSRQIETEKINSMFEGFGGLKNARKYIKENSKRKAR